MDGVGGVQGGTMTAKRHQIWATISGSEKEDLVSQVKAVADWGIESIEYRLDLIPTDLWRFVLNGPRPRVSWWVAHFGTGDESKLAHDAAEATISSGADGVIFHSHCDGVDQLVRACRSAGKPFAAPFHSQEPLTRKEALEEFAYQQSLSPSFRKIAVRAHSYDDAASLIDATRQATLDGGCPVVGAIFGGQRWARIALPHAGSAITFVVAHRVKNEVQEDDEQLQLSELGDLCRVPRVMASDFYHLGQHRTSSAA
jgi:Type I 3-dehydroquinase